MAGSKLTFSRNRELLGPGSALGVIAEAPNDPLLALALAQDASFPPGTIELGRLEVRAQAGRDVVFGKEGGRAVFKAEGGAHAGLGVYSSGAAALAALDLDSELGQGIALPDGDGARYVMLRWGYDAQATAKGSVALGAGLGGTFAGEASREGAFGVIRRLPAETGARTAVRETVNSWMLPRQVRSVDQLAPGTWLVAEVDGSLGLKLGALYGYDFNWVRETELGGLAGEIGLRVQLGAAVALGFNASGRYAVVVSRDSLDPASKELRVRLFKLARKGMSFALQAGATVDGDTGAFLPESFDKFVAAIFGLDPAQVIEDLETLRRWTDPDEELADLLAGAGVDRARELLEKVTGLDLESEFEEARGRVLALLDRWNELDHELASRVWSLADDGGKLTRVRELAERITAIDREGLRAVLGHRLAQVDFFATPEGQWLEAAVGEPVIAAVTNAASFRRLQSAASKTLALLDGSRVEEALGRLHRHVSERLAIDRIREAVDETSFETMDGWLKARLAGFLDAKLDLEKLGEIRKTLNLLLDKKDRFYEQALAALNRSYSFQITATYQKSTARAALLDVAFDFGQGDPGEALRSALEGRFDTLLVEEIPGVRLNLATLTHQVTRQGTVAVDFPFYDKSVTRLNEALARVSAVEDDGRLLLYDLDAKDVVQEAFGAKSLRNSRLAIGGYLPVELNNRVRVRSRAGLGLSYSFREATADLRRQGLEGRLKPYVDRYFPRHFAAPGAFSVWLGDLDRAIDAIEFNGTDIFGNTLLALEVTLPAEVTAAWLRAPLKANDPIYFEMSRRLQGALKETLVASYFGDPRRFKNVVPARTLLAWSAIPPSTSVEVAGDGTVILDTGRDVFWDWPHRPTRRAMLLNELTQVRLTAELTRIHRRLEGEPGLTARQIEAYEPTVGNVRAAVNDALGSQDEVLRALLFFESRVVQPARDAGLELARFQAEARTRPSEAIEALAKFGAKITSAFNQRLATVYKGSAPLRPLGTQLFMAAAQAFDPRLTDLQPAAMAELTVLKRGVVPFPPKGFPNYAPPAKEEVVISERIVSL